MIRQYCICYNVTLLQEYQMPRHLEFIESFIVMLHLDDVHFLPYLSLTIELGTALGHVDGDFHFRTEYLAYVLRLRRVVVDVG